MNKTQQLARCLLLTVLMLPACPRAQRAQKLIPAGGPIAPPPLPSQIANLGTDTNFQGTPSTDWHTISCVSVDPTTGHAGSYSLKVSGGSCSSTELAYQQVTLPSSGYKLQYFYGSMWVKADGSFATTGSNPSVFWNLHAASYSDYSYGGNPAREFTFFGRSSFQGNASDWTELQFYGPLDQTMYGGKTLEWQLDIGSTAFSGNLWISDVTIGVAWTPLHNFLTYPNYKGFLWSDGSLVISGVSELAPPTAATSASSLTIKLTTDSACSNTISGSSETISGPALYDPTTEYPMGQNWSIDTSTLPLTASTTYYVCSTATWSDGSTSAGDTWAVVWKFPAATRNSTFANWINADGSWVHKGVRRVPFGAYDNWNSFNLDGNSGEFSTGGSCTPPQSSAANCYLYDVRGGGYAAPTASPNPSSIYGGSGASVFADYTQNHFNFVDGSISNFSAINPTPLASQATYNPNNSTDQFTPFLYDLDQFGIADSQVMNSWYGSLVNGTKTPAAPSTAGMSLTEVAGGGTFSSGVYVFAEITGVSNQPWTGGQWALVETTPSAPLSLPIATTNDSVEVTLPGCDATSRKYMYDGLMLYVATNSTNTAPGNSSFMNATGGSYLACGATFTLGAVPALVRGVVNPYAKNASPNPPTTDETLLNTFPAWVGSTTPDTTTWQELAQALSEAQGASGNYGQGGAAWYTSDEPVVLDLGEHWYQMNYLQQYAPDLLDWGVSVNGAGAEDWRFVWDMPGVDPYGYGAGNAVTDNFANDGTRTCTAWITPSAPVLGTAGTQCFLSRIDLETDDINRFLYGSRPMITVYQFFQAGAVYGFTYPEVRRQMFHAMVGCQNWGSLGCGDVAWTWGQNSGAVIMWYGGYPIGSNPQPLPRQWYVDFQHAASDFTALAPVWLGTTQDSAELSPGSGQVDGTSGRNVINRFTHSGSGFVLSNVKLGSTLATICGSASGYVANTLYPFGPVRFVTKQMPNGDQYILAVNLCSAGAPFNVTFTLSNPPANAVVELVGTDDPAGGPGTEDLASQYNGPPARTYTLSGNAFTATWKDEDAHVYRIHSPGSSEVTGLITVSGAAVVH